MKEKLRKSLGIFLIVIMTVTSLPLEAFASGEEKLRDVDFTRPEAVSQETETEPGSTADAAEEPLREPVAYYEEEEPEGTLVYADEYMKTYQLSERSFSTEIGGEPGVYETDDGDYALVDNTLTLKKPLLSENYYENEANDYDIRLPEEMTEETGVEITKDGCSIEMIPLEGDFTKPVAEKNALLYNNVYEGIDFQYTVLGDVIKEDIVLNKVTERNTFSFELRAENLTAKEEQGAIALYGEDDKEAVYTIVAPVMTDSAGNVSTDLQLTLGERDGKQIVTLTAGREWLEDAVRAYPVRIDPTITVTNSKIGLYCVEQNAPDMVIGDNSYPYCGYDDGITSGTLDYGAPFFMTRTYVDVDYDFSKISKEAKIDSATLSLYHYTAWSEGKTSFGLYEMNDAWNPSTLTWNSQLSASHTFVQYDSANKAAGWLHFDVRDTVNNWVQGIKKNRGFVLKARDERNMQCEVFENKNGSNKPKLVINWSIPDPVDPGYKLDHTTVSLRPISEKNINGKLVFDGLFADGVATPESTVTYWLDPNGSRKTAAASLSYKYPDSSPFQEKYPQGTKYKDKLGNWQTGLYEGFSLNKAYRIRAYASKEGETGKTVSSEKFLIYKVRQKDTFPYIANHYGVNLNTLMKDNQVQDTLVIENNTIFIRNPKTEIAYSPGPLSDAQKKAIDSALMGRGKHCEYGFEPINLNTGNFYLSAADAQLEDYGGTFLLERSYNSKADGANSLFGRNWSFAYDESLSKCEDGSIAYAVGDGKTLYFKPDKNGGYISPIGYHYTLKPIEYTQNKVKYIRYELHQPDGSYRKFNAWGLLTGIVDSNGFETTISYDANYNIKSIKTPAGKTFTITVNDSGRISSITLPNGAVLRYKYNEDGQLTSYTDANGNTVRYEYDSSHRMTAWYDQDGNRIVKNQYDSQGRVTKQTDGNGKVSTLQYEENQTVTTDAEGDVTTYTYDDLGRTTQIQYPDGKTETRTYDEAGNLASDDTYTYTYDADGNKLTETREDGKVRTYTYNGSGQVTGITDFDGKKTTMVYTAGDVTKITYPDGSSESYTYDSSHRMTAHTDANGNRETFTYEGAVPVSHTDYRGNTYRYAYNTMNQVVSVTAPDGSISRTMYDKAGNKTGEQAPDGGYTAYTLNKLGNTVSITDPEGNVTGFTYDAMANIVQGTDAMGNTVSYTYDSNGNVLTETDAAGYRVSYTYDGRDRVTEMVDRNGGVSRYTYDMDGNLTQTVNPDGSTGTMAYDEVLDLPVKITDGLGNVTEMEYDAAGNITQITYPDKTTQTYRYDGRYRVISATDPTGLQTDYTYDGNGNLLQMTEGGSRTWQYQYDGNGNLLEVTDPEGKTIRYTYDALNRKTKETDQNGGETLYGYDAAGRMIQATDALGNQAFFTYNRRGDLITAASPSGAVTTYTYDGNGNLVQEEDALGNVTGYSYDSKDQLQKVTDALGGETTYTYDGNGNILSVTDALGNTTVMTYDSVDNMTAVSLSNGDTSVMTYDANGNVTGTSDAAGLEKTYTYDAMGRVLTAKDNTGAEITYSYDRYGRLLSQRDVLGREESYEYDGFSQVTAVTGTDGNRTAMTYDGLGRLLSITDAEGKTTGYIYDAAGSLTGETEPDGSQYIYTYDAIHRLTKTTDPLGTETLYTYDGEGNLTGVTDGNGVKTGYTYDALNRLVTETDGNGNQTTYEYDELSRLLALTEPEGGRTEYRYDAIGNVTREKDANGYITEFVYDSTGNMTKAISQRGAEISYTYDKHNQVTSVTDAKGNVTRYEVDLNGMVLKMIQPNKGEYVYEYDQVNRITGITTPNGYFRGFTYDRYGNVVSERDNMDRETVYAYDKMHRVTKVTDAQGGATLYSYDGRGNLSSVITPGGGETSYVYDLLDRVTKETDPEGQVTQVTYDKTGNIKTITEPGERTTTMEYDGNYNVTSVTDPMGYRTAYRYDGNNNLTAVTDALGNTDSYTYDALGQVTEVKDPADAVTKYTYDAHGNVVKVTDPKGRETKYTYDLADRLTKVTDPAGGEVTYGYDAMGNLTSVTDGAGGITGYTYDLEGNLTSVTDPAGRKEEMTYDLAGNLKSVVRPDATTVEYDYNKLNSLVSKSYSEDDTEVLYLYDTEGRRTEMTDSHGETTYEYDLCGRLSEVRNSDGRTTGYTYDEAGNLASITYADGRVVHYSYDKNDRLTKVTDNGKETVYTYDAIGSVTETKRPDGSSTGYSYENRRLVSLTNRNAEGKILSSFAYTYDEEGYITKEISVCEGRETVREYEYTERGELERFTESENGKVKTSYTYSYDSRGNRSRLEITGEKPQTITYRYNKSNQLTEKNSSTEGKTVYTYDENGSLIAEKTEGEEELTYEYTVEQRLSAVREGGALLMAASYDGDGNRIFQLSRYETETTPEKEDASGEKEGREAASGEEEDGEISRAEEEESLFWYGFGQGFFQMLGGIHTAISAYLSDAWDSAWDYLHGQYDLKLYSRAGLGSDYGEEDIEAILGTGLSEEETAAIISGAETREASVVIPQNPEEETGFDYELTYYVNDVNTENTRVLMEYGKGDELKNTYTYGAERISAETITDGEDLTADDRKTGYYLYDGRGSVAQVLTEGAVTERYTYDPFGNVTEGAPEFDSFYGYNGEDTSPVTGMQYLRARYYDTEDGRFNVADTYLGDISKPLTLNRYTYTANNPVMHTDPTGHWPQWLDNAWSKVKDVGKSVIGWVQDKIIDPVADIASTIGRGVKDICTRVKESVRAATDPEKISAKVEAMKKGIHKFFCGDAEKIDKDVGGGKRDKGKKEAGCPRKQMPEEAKQKQREEAGKYYRGMGDSILGTIDGIVFLAGLYWDLTYGTPSQRAEAVETLRGIGGSIAAIANDPGAFLSLMISEVQRVADEEGTSYIAGYITGELLQMFFGGAVVKGADTTADIGKGAKFVDNLDDVADAGKVGRRGKDVIGDIITDGSHYENGKLKPNVVYKAGEHEYIYKTNENGLIVNASTDNLQFKTHEGRMNHNPNTYGKEKGDHAGHLFGDRFGGSSELDNLVSQAKKVNLSEYKVIENQWARALENGQNVKVNISIDYVAGSSRPVSFDVTYIIDDVRYHKIIYN